MNFTFLRSLSWLFVLAATFSLSNQLMAQADATGCIACNDQINVTLDKECSVYVTLDMVAEGSFKDCPDGLEEALEVIVYDGDYKKDVGPDNIVGVCGLFNYVIQLKAGYEDKYTWEMCWGKVNAEDKTDPEVICPEDVIGLLKKPVEKNPEATIDDQGYVYEPGNPDDQNCSEDKDYCDRECGESTVEGYEFNYLVCTDVENVYNVSDSWTDSKYPYYTGAVSEVHDCSETSLVSVKDELRENECEDGEVKWGREVSAVIYRTFTYVDEKGNEGSCTQKIYFFRPQIFLPECKYELDLCKWDEVTADNSEETIDPVATGSGPYYINGMCQKVYLDGHSCNLTVTYEDTVLPGPENCGVKIIRTWTILDWCWDPDRCDLFTAPVDCRSAFKRASRKDKVATYEQHIIIKDYKAPEVECPTVDYDWDGEADGLVFSTGPFNCTAVINPPAPVVKGECDENWTWEFELWGYITDPKTGLKTHELIGYSGDGVLNGVPPGYYTLKYLVRDACGNEGYAECEVHVADKIEPVAICDDELNISIGGAYTTAEGLARVTAADVDEGSWDNCELESLDIRRNIDEDCLIIYGDLVNGLAWPEDYEEKEGPNGSTVYLAGKSVAANGVSKGDTLVVKEADGSYYSWWANAIYFTCCDISADADDKITIELRATDTYGNSNVCWLKVLIEDKLPPRCDVHDKWVLCTEVDFDPSNAEEVAGKFGDKEDVVKLVDNCGADIEEEVIYTPGNCGEGKIERVFTITDASGRTTTCTQTIYIEEVNDYSIKFPADLGSAECGVEPEEDIITSSDACDILAVSRDTTRFEASGDECFKLLVTYSVINWCEYDGETLEPTTIKRDIDEDDKLEECTWVDAQAKTVKYLNDNLPLCDRASWPGSDSDELFVVLIYGQDDDTGLREDYPRRILVREDCSVKGKHYGYAEYEARFYYKGDDLKVCYYLTCKAKGSAEYLCENAEYQCWTPGYYEYTQLVKVYDNIAPEIQIESELTFCAYGSPESDCDGNVDITFWVKDDCTQSATEVRSVKLDVNNGGNPQDLEGILYDVREGSNNFTYQITGKLPVGEHTFVVSASDGCGNLTGKRIPFSVEDCKSPAPICIQTLSVDLMPVDADDDGTVDGGMNTVWAVDFLASDIDDCSAFEEEPRNVKYFAFLESALAAEGRTIEDLTEEDFVDKNTSVVVTCDEEGTEIVYVVALDAAGNWDYCTAMAVVAPGVSPSPCGGRTGSGSIAGIITSEEDDQVEGVTVSLSGQTSMSYLTDESGSYAFEGLIEGYDYSVAPSLDENHLNGVSTFDLVLISKHILGVKPLDSAYKLIAADVNNSQSVTTLDLIQLRKLILSIDTKFSNNTSWRFVSRDYAFPNAANPWAAVFPEVVNANNLPTNELVRDFVAIKVGDVNGNAQANALVGTDTRNVAGTMDIAVADVSLQSGEEYTVDFRASDLAAIEGYQFTLNYDRSAVELVDVLYGLAVEDNFGVFASEGAITTSWNGDATGDDVLFSLVLRAKADVELSQTLSVNSRLTVAEAYNTNNDVLDVALDFGQGTVTRAGFELYQNSPNPFREQTLVSFTLPEAATAQIKVSDINGRILKVIEGDFTKGYNELRLEKGDLPAGVLTYTLETKEFSATKKMISVK